MRVATMRRVPRRPHWSNRSLARLGVAFAAASPLVTSSSPAFAEPPAPSASLPDGFPFLTLLVPPARLVGGHGGGGGGGGRALIQPSGWYIGVDGGGALLVGVGDARTTGAPAVGGHAGYRLPSGLAFDLRADDLGVSAPDGSGPLVAGGFGMRYTIPLEIMPFVEVHLGALDYGSNTSFAGDVGAGLALPIGNHLEIDLSARDWIGGVDGQIRHAPMFALGVVVGFNEGR